MIRLIILLLALPVTTFIGHSANHNSSIKNLLISKPDSIYHKGWIDLNKNGKMDPYENQSLPIEKRIDDLVSRMNVNEKTAQMVTLYGYGRVLKDELPNDLWLGEPWSDGIGNIDEQLNSVAYHPNAQTKLSWPPSRHAKAMNEIQKFFIEQTRLGIPADFTNEGIRGLASEKATSFPAEIGVGSSWDVDLVNKIGHVVGKEAHALGYTNIYSPILGVSRDPRWGRVVETFGEDPYLNAQYGVATVTGIQDEGVASTLKHFAVYSEPKGGRDGDARTDPHVTPRDVYTIFLPPFEAAVKAGALGIMSSYNDYNGIPITGSYHFLTQILRQQWGFKGYIVTDSGALQYIYEKHHVASDFKGAIKQAVEAGVNVRTNFQPPSVYLDPLRELVNDGEIPMSVINERVRQILYVKFKLGLFDHPYVDVQGADSLVRTKQSETLALRAAHESLVLLKNQNNVLPLNKNKIRSILVTGANATETDHSVSRYGPSHINVISTLDGIKSEVGKNVRVTYVKGPEVTDKDWPVSDIEETPLSKEEKSEIAKAIAAARKSDVAIVVVGENRKTVGEGHSRVSLNLPGHQLQLVQSLYNTGTPTVVVLLNGRPLSINWINDHVPGILEAWFPGEKEGEAIADALFGDYNPGGKLPITFPKTVGQVPLNFPYMPASQEESNAKPAAARVTGPLYPFGYGLSYTSFQYSDLKISPEKQNTGGRIQVSLNVKNTGRRKGDEVVQLYLHEQTAPVIVPVKVLRGFDRITLDPGETKQVTFNLTPHDFQLLDKNMNWEVVPGTFDVMVGSSSEDIRAKGQLTITGSVSNKAYGM